nr:MAG TPA: hypothetical protein [Caudoviricetes sp.]
MIVSCGGSRKFRLLLIYYKSIAEKWRKNDYFFCMAFKRSAVRSRLSPPKSCRNYRKKVVSATFLLHKFMLNFENYALLLIYYKCQMASVILRMSSISTS